MKKFVLSSLFLVLTASLAFAQNTGGLKGKVRDTKGKSISGVTITVRQKGEDLKSLKSDSKGEFVMEGLKPGMYNVVFERDGYGTGVLYNVEVQKKKVGDLGNRLVMRVDQGTLVIINGSVFNQFGGSIYGAKVEIERISGNSTKNIGSSYTSQSGEFIFRFPEKADRFRITATAKGVSASKEIEVSEAAVYRLALTLEMPKNN
ncbi:hypothetical protein BH20ACI4_BH20ACI4_05000 [soil metagenome]